MAKSTISEIISMKEISKWEKRDIVFIEAGTGQGKSYFITNSLYKYVKKNNKKILFLVNRSSLYKQIFNEIKKYNKLDVIDIVTYQKIEYLNLYKKREYDFTRYDYIVCDEFHYFLNDSTFSDRTDVTFQQVMRNQNATKIFMSATGKNMKRYINENINMYVDSNNIKIRNYSLPIKYDFINKLYFFYNDESFDELIKKFIEEGNKAIFFIQSLEKAKELYIRYEKYCLFNCSKKEKRYYKYVNSKKIEKMLQEEKFEEQILITTPCMDSGVNIKDINLKNIVVSIYDLDTLIQCIGRKRLENDDEKINLYVKYINNKVFGGIYTEITKRLKQMEYLKTHTDAEYIDKYPRNDGFNRAIYDVNVLDKGIISKKINPLIEFKYKLILEEIQTIQSYNEYKFKYGRYLLDNLQIKDYKLLEEEKRKTMIYEYLYAMEGKLIDKEERKKLIEIFNQKDSFGRMYKSISKLNKYLQNNNYEFEIKVKVIKNKTYWVLVKRKFIADGNL